ncbi:MAG: polysaccharide biosynthesis tyrosine autokinase [Phycisphaerae bacterium]|nr:polysaccharide biosynthesis tyrosine autokinase [Phycisphaerae bacterium]
MTSLPTTTTTHVPTVPRPDGLPMRPGAAAPAPGINFRQIISMLLRHLWLALTVFFVIQIVTWGVFAACYKWKKTYAAVGSMTLSEKSDLYTSWKTQMPDQATIDNMMALQSSRITAEQILDLVLKQTDAKSWMWMELHKDDKNGPLQTLTENISAGQLKKTPAMTVRVTDRNPKAAAEMCNEIMKFYSQWTKDASTLKVTGTRKLMEAQRDSKKSDLNNSQRRLADMRNSEDFEALERNRGEAIQRADYYSNLSMNKGIEVEAAKRNLDLVQDAHGDPSKPPSAELLSSLDNSTVLADLIRQRQSLIQRQGQLEEICGPNHPDLKAINVAIDEMDQNIRARRLELAQTVRAGWVTDAQAKYREAKAQLESADASLRQAREDKRKLELKWADFTAETKKRDSLETEIQQLQTAIQAADTQISRGLTEVEVLFNAAPPRPEDIAFPRWEIFLAGGLVLGLALSIGLVLLIELANSSIRTPRDISDQVRMPLLGFVPIVNSGNTSHSEIARLVMREPMSMLAESFRQIRTNLLFSAPADQLHSIAVTSAASDEGKTTVATNLAITIALSGRRVLLVDANFRRPALSEVFALTGAAGLSNVLTTQATLAEAAQPTDVPNLAVLTTGPTPPNPAELLGSATMRQLLDAADAEYDVVLFDAPPALLVSDALALATMVDGVITIARASQTSRGMLARLRDQLARVNAHVIGAVLNATRATRGGYFREAQQQYEDYNRLPA